ncbi:hypothetical protein Tco_0111821 [Tanacetum coccineum]
MQEPPQGKKRGQDVLFVRNGDTCFGSAPTKGIRIGVKMSTKQRDHFMMKGSMRYKRHMSPTKSLFKRLKDNFRMLDIEEDERKFIFSYGVGEASVETKDGTLGIGLLSYPPMSATNAGLRSCLHDEEREGGMLQGDRIEELKMDKEKDQDYIDDDYLSMNGTLYAMKVNTFPRTGCARRFTTRYREVLIHSRFVGFIPSLWDDLAQRSKHRRPGENVVGTSSGTTWKREPHAFAWMRSVEIVDTLEDGTPKGTAQVDVKDESNSEGTTNKDLEDYTSSSDDFIVIT